ncbi:hypothetical protein EMIT0215P_30148 [Pseudomonas serboccidentalis]
MNGISDIANDSEGDAASGLDLGNHLINIFSRARNDRDRRTLHREKFSDGSADTPTGAGDNGNFFIESSHVVPHYLRASWMIVTGA